MKKKLLSLALSGIMLLSLVACGNSGHESNPSSESQGNYSEATSTDKVENVDMTVSVGMWDTDGSQNFTDCSGNYSGEMLNDAPNGNGSFSYEKDGMDLSYEGQFENGTFNGEGVLTFSTSEGEVELYQNGTFINGLFQPNTPELFNSISDLTTPSFSISTENVSFMQEHLNLFPAATDADLTEAQTFVKSDLTYPMMTKTLDGLEGALYSYTPAHAIQVFQEDIYGHTITYILCGDENGNYYSIFYDGVLPDVYDGVYISFTGLPVSPSGFENVGGGTTNVMVIIASSVAVI